MPDTIPGRRQKRLLVRVPIQIRLLATDAVLAGVSRDISWGGALFVIPTPALKEGDVVVIQLPWSANRHIDIQAIVLRANRLPSDACRVAARFVTLSYQNHVRFLKLMAMLDTREQATDANSQLDLFQELKLVTHDVDNFHDIMSAIATGQYTIPLLNEYYRGQSIVLCVEGPNNSLELRLRARVVKVATADSKTVVSPHLFHVTLGFEHPRESLAALADHLRR